jgi:hypothetical protein
VLYLTGGTHPDHDSINTFWTLDKPNWQDKKIVQSRKMRML